MRSTRPAAVATLPALTPSAAAPHANGHAPANGNGHHASPFAPPQQPPPSLVQAVAAAAPIPLAIQPGAAEAAAILPPRPTGRFPAPSPRASSWKSWPVIVIVLAVVAIVTAIVLMLFPPGGARDPGRSDVLSPAPDRMDTNPAPSTPRKPPAATPDPWDDRRGARTTPSAPPAPADDPDIDSPDLDPPISTRPRLPGRSSGPNMLYSMIKHACSRLAECGTINAPVKTLCDRYTSAPSLAAPSCAAASRCLRGIDEMSCDASIDDPMSLLDLQKQIPDCAEALSC
jgi:hypothetical protein